MGLVFGALLSLEVGLPSSYVVIARMCTAVLLALSAVATTLSLTLRLRETWYSGRAAAESIKTLSWRYGMGAEPFSLREQTADIDTLFIERLRAALRDTDIAGARIPPAADCGGSQITAEMRSLRSADPKTKLQVYSRERLRGQLDWYRKRAADNAKSHDRLTWFAGGLQALAVLLAIVLATQPQWMNPVGVVTTIAAVVVAWGQARGYEELANAYGTSAQELQMVLAEAESGGTAELSKFVLDAEQAISREHTLWIARRSQRHSLQS